ncbi:MAG TPA: prolipoprotein diacylglyceryl transferase, partial [Natronosporangium sp.]
LPIRAYALFIIAGIIVACVVTEARLRARGAPPNSVLDIAVWAVPFGIVGGRLYHVITTPHDYFGADGDPIKALYVWEGGLGIWGAIAGGALGVWFACRQLHLPFRVVADTAAVGIPLAQALGRLGNWFNNELYGARDDDLPWGLQVYRMEDGRAQTLDGEPIAEVGLYHPTFLYELLWNVGVAILVWQVGKRLKLGGGRQFALYVMAYTVGRFWIELLRIDDTSEVPTPGAEDLVTMIGPWRLNAWVSILVFLAALAYFVRVRTPQEFLLPATDGPGYRVVTEEEYERLRGAEPAATDAAAAGGDAKADGDDGEASTGGSAEAGGDDGPPEADGDQGGEGEPAARVPAGADEPDSAEQPDPQTGGAAGSTAPRDDDS